MTLIAVAFAVFWLAWSNGANDNFKGVATLYGCGAASFRTALRWATGATVLGSLASVLLAHTLIKRFSGHGLIPDEIITPAFLGAVAAAAGVTVLLATWIGMPTSTTHALTGALVGAAVTADWHSVNWQTLATKFAQPLLLSPILAVGLTLMVYPFLSWLRKRTGVERQTCICIGQCAPQPVQLSAEGIMARSADGLTIEIGDESQCVERYDGNFVGMNAHTAVNGIHYASGAAVCFARAVNDTPKIAALLLACVALDPQARLTSTGGLLIVAFAMAAGGWLQSRKVAETMSKRITDLNPGQGLTANLITAALVLGASRLGVPVSTTHVSCGSIFGIGLVNRKRQWSTIAAIAVTWLTTLPLGMALGAMFFWLAAA